MKVRSIGALTALAIIFANTGAALAYVDPGVTGSIFQLGYVMFYAFVGMLAFFFRPIKMFFQTVSAKLGLSKKPAETTEEETSDVPA